jgi:hypothetical protein
MPKLGLGLLLPQTGVAGGFAITNPNFSNLTGLTDLGGGNYAGVPFGWLSEVAPPDPNSVKSTDGVFYANLQVLSQINKVYLDDFSTNPGALNGRATATGFGAWTTSDSAFQVGSDKITINSNTPVDYHRASFSLPSLGASDILSFSITVRPSGANFMGIGFTPNSGQYLTNTGVGWIYFEGLGAPTPNIQIFKGPAATGAIYFATLANPALNFDASLPTTFQYTYSAAAQTLTIIATNGGKSSTLLNNADVSSIPLSSFSNFALQFQGQTLGSDTNPAYVDSLSVSINGFKTFYQDIGTLQSSATASLSLKAGMLTPGIGVLGFAFYDATNKTLIASGGATITSSPSSPQTVLFNKTVPAGIPIRLALWSSGIVGIRDISITLS